LLPRDVRGERCLLGTSTETARAPGGLFYGWIVLGAGTASAFTAVVFFNPILGVFVSELHAEFGWSRAELALAITIGSVIAGVAGPLAGWAVDRWGGRWVIAGGAATMAVCLVLLAGMSELWQLYALYSTGRAVSFALVASAAYVAVSNWFVRRRGLAVGLVAAGSRAGMALLPLMVAVVIGATGSWRMGWLALAGVAAAIGVLPSLLLIRRRPEDMGLRPDGDVAPALDEEGEAGVTAAAPEHDLAGDFTLRQALQTRAFWLIGIAVALAMFAQGSVNFHQIPHLEDQGLSRTQAALVVTVFSSVGALGGLVGGLLSARLRMRWTMVFSLLGMAGAILLLVNVDTMAEALVYATIYGLFFGANFTMVQAIYADYYGRRSLGLIRGAFQPVQLGMNAAGPFVAGLWFDRTGSYAAPFTLFSAMFLVAAAALAFASYPRRSEAPARR
jgi:MFS family permease